MEPEHLEEIHTSIHEILEMSRAKRNKIKLYQKLDDCIKEYSVKMGTTDNYVVGDEFHTDPKLFSKLPAVEQAELEKEFLQILTAKFPFRGFLPFVADHGVYSLRLEIRVGRYTIINKTADAL